MSYSRFKVISKLVLECNFKLALKHDDLGGMLVMGYVFGPLLVVVSDRVQYMGVIELFNYITVKLLLNRIVCDTAILKTI